MEDRLDGITGDTINPIERGDVRRPRDNKQQKLAGLFGVSLGYLQTGQPHHPEGPDEDILNYPVGRYPYTVWHCLPITPPALQLDLACAGQTRPKPAFVRRSTVAR